MILNPETPKAYELLHKGTLAFARAEQQGIRVDMEYSKRQRNDLTDRIKELESVFMRTKFYRHWVHVAGKAPNIHSGDQLRKFLYGHKKLEPAYRTEKGLGAVDEEALSQLNIPELNDLVRIKKLLKIRDTYLDAFVREAVNGVIHPSFNLHLARTFRSSSDKPNFQNIPKRDEEAADICRGALFARKGHQLAEIDYGSLEVRIATAYHKDPVMMKYNKDPTTDMHTDMAKQIFLIDDFDKKIPEHKILRAATKNGFVFPEFYGDYYKNCAKNMACKWGRLSDGKWKKGQGLPMPTGKLSDHMISVGICSLDDFTAHLKEIEFDFWGNRFKEYSRWKQKWWKQYQRTGYLDLLTGFRCGGMMSRKNAINYPIQGSAFHCLLWSFIELDRIFIKEKLDTRIIGQIHDAIVLDVHPDELEYVMKIVKRVTCEDLPNAWGWINVPLEIEADVGGVDKSWAEMKPYTLP